MTVIEAEKVTDAILDAYLNGEELIIELTGQSVIYVGLYSHRHIDRWAFLDETTGHLHEAAEITVKGKKRSELL